MTDSFLLQLLVLKKHSSLSLLKNCDVLMVQSTNCIIILVPIPSLPKPPFLTALISCKHSCRFSPLRNTGYPMRKLTIHFGNCPPIKRQGKLPLTLHNITRVFNKNLSRWQNFRSRRRMKYSRLRRKTLGGSGGILPGKFRKFGLLRMHFLHPRQELGYLNRTGNTNHR